MTTGFSIYRLDEVCDIQIGKTPRREVQKYWGTGFCWVSISDLRSPEITYTKEQITETAIRECGCKLVPKGTILFSFKLTIGKIAFAGKDLFTNEAIAALPIKRSDLLHPSYLYYVLKNIPVTGSNNAAMGATLNKESLSNLKIPVPASIEEQIHIANILSKAEALINKRKESLRLLDEFLKSTFLEMFGDPVKNEKCFGIKAIEEVCENIFLGLTSKVEYVDQGGFPLIRATDIADGKLSFDKAKYISEKQHRLITKNRISKRGDLLISKSGSLGTCAIVHTDLPFTTYESIITVQVIPSLLNNRYLMFLIRNSNFQIKMLGGKVGGTVGHLNLQTFRNIQLPVPSIELQERFAFIVEKTESLKMQCETSLAELQNLYASLSQRAFEGELQFKPEAKVIQLQTEKEEDYFKKRKALACYIINQSLDDDKFGDTKFEKLLFLSDYDAIKRNFGQHYYQKVAGPYDNTFTNTFYIQIENSKLFKRKRGDGQTRFLAGANHVKSFTASDYFSEEELKRVNKLIKIFEKSDYEQPEIIATLYAVWNNRIIQKQQITDELLKQDFLKWDAKKEKYKDRLDAALVWMRKENIVPDGWGKLIELPKVRVKKVNDKF